VSRRRFAAKAADRRELRRPEGSVEEVLDVEREVEPAMPVAEVQIVVQTDGRVAAARAVRTVGFGLDEAVLHAIRAYRFSPALRAGRPVRVRMRWTVQFRLR
jgi:TonB family protein